jgi:hypothetical protein
MALYLMERKSRPADPPFEGYLLYGPVLHKEEQRRYVFLVHESNKSRTTTAYARYLMSVLLGRRLTASEQVDHIDNDKLNDVISNLQILTRTENLKKLGAARGVKTVVLKCPSCSKEFERRISNTHIAKGGIYTACSRKCSGYFSVMVSKYGKAAPEDHVVKVYQKISAVS